MVKIGDGVLLLLYPIEPRKLVILLIDKTLSFDDGKSGNLSLVHSSNKEVASCNVRCLLISEIREIS
jgi:hypothetical protein